MPLFSISGHPILEWIRSSTNATKPDSPGSNSVSSMHTSPDHMREAFRAGDFRVSEQKFCCFGTSEGAARGFERAPVCTLQGVSTGPMSTTTRRGASELFRDLTPRQREVLLQLVAEGKSAKMIAGILSPFSENSGVPQSFHAGITSIADHGGIDSLCH